MPTGRTQQLVDASDATVFRPSLAQRLGFGGLAVVTVIAVVAGVVQDSALWLVFLVPSVLLFVETIRTRVVVDRADGVVRITRSMRTTTTPISDVLNVRVPPWGPVLLTMRSSAAGAGANWPGQINTGIQVSHRGFSAAHQLADCLGVPVESVWRGVRAPAAVDDVRPSWVICSALAFLAAVLVALFVAEYLL